MMKSLFVMDPIEGLDITGDSTFMVMKELTRRKQQVSYTTVGRLYARDGVGRAGVTTVRVVEKAPFFEVINSTDCALDDFDVVWMRKDPPFDMSYIQATYILDMAQTAMVVNDPVGLKLFNEKIWAMRFPDLHPPTLFSSDVGKLRAFAAEHGRIVLKPWDGNGGRGVLIAAKKDRNLNSMIDLLTNDGTQPIIAQPFIEGISNGDMRVLLFDGEPVGAMLRIPGESDYRGNMHVGASVVACELSERDQHICDVLRPELKKWGQLFVGIDIIDGFLTEINVTSPTGIVEINQLYGTSLESDLVNIVEKRWQHRGG
jgi:glutathione synthase